MSAVRTFKLQSGMTPPNRLPHQYLRHHNPHHLRLQHHYPSRRRSDNTAKTMKFGEHLSKVLLPEWQAHYM